jgi:hypothetical protein
MLTSQQKPHAKGWRPTTTLKKSSNKRRSEMMTPQEIQKQEAHVDYLKSEMQVGYAELEPTGWSERRGYIPTCEYYNRTGPGTWTEGIDFVVLDDTHIAMRTSGDFRDDGEWHIVDPDEFVDAVNTDAEEFLARWREEYEDA